MNTCRKGQKCIAPLKATTVFVFRCRKILTEAVARTRGVRLKTARQQKRGASFLVGYSVSDFKNTEGVKSETSSSLLSLSSFKKKAWSKENTALKQQCPFSIENAHPIAFSALVWCVGGLAEFQRNSARCYKEKPSLSGAFVFPLTPS